jgi:phenylalanyl-tRNA synthetase alpha chain
MTTPPSSDDLSAYEAEGLEQIAGAATADALKEVDGALLGKRSDLLGWRKSLGGLEPDQRRELGLVLNELRSTLEAAVQARRDELARSGRRVQLEAERLDLTERVERSAHGHLHPVTRAIQELEDTFVGMGFTVSEGPEVETDWYAFEALNIPTWHPARSMWDTIYVDLNEPGSTLLRPHTSPVQIRLMESQPPPIYSVMPGRVFRQETSDATHLAVFHQIEGLVIDRGITFGDLAGTIDAFTKAYFGDRFSSRLRPSYFPFTEPSAEFDIRTPDGSWLELGGCGMVHPNVLGNVGIDPEEFSGFAFGFGIDRLAGSRYGVSDIREMFSNDVRFLEQF